MSNQSGSDGKDKMSNAFATFINEKLNDGEYLSKIKGPEEAHSSSSTTKAEATKPGQPATPKACNGSQFDAMVKALWADGATEEGTDKFNDHCDVCDPCDAKRLKLMGNLRPKRQSY